MPADEKLISGSTTKSPASGTPLSKSSSEEDTAAAKRAAFHRQLSGTNSPSRPKLEHQLSRDGSLRRRSSAYRRQSSFDLAHVNSILSVPDLKSLEAIDKSLGKNYSPWS